MGILTLILSIVGAVVALLSFVPSLAFFKWIGGVIVLAGLIIGILGARGEKRTASLVGLIISAVFLVFAVLRIIGLF
jgi:hypothetical protein